jgi:hypothetical protein
MEHQLNPVKYKLDAECQDDEGNDLLWYFGVLFRNQKVAEQIEDCGFDVMLEELNKKILKPNVYIDGVVELIDVDDDTVYKWEGGDNDHEIVESWEHTSSHKGIMECTVNGTKIIDSK